MVEEPHAELLGGTEAKIRPLAHRPPELMVRR